MGVADATVMASAINRTPEAQIIETT